jgi:acyl carrier protein
LAFKAETLKSTKLVLWYVTAEKKDIKEEDIKFHLAMKLPPCMLPDIIEKVEAIAYSSNGKKIRNNEKIASQNRKSSNQDSINSLVYEIVKKVVRRVAGSSIQNGESAFESLNSLEYVNLIVALEDALDIEFDIDKLNMAAFSSSSMFAEHIIEMISSKEKRNIKK